jgi:hypothetical protein
MTPVWCSGGGGGGRGSGDVVPPHAVWTLHEGRGDDNGRLLPPPPPLDVAQPMDAVRALSLAARSGRGWSSRWCAIKLQLRECAPFASRRVGLTPAHPSSRAASAPSPPPLPPFRMPTRPLPWRHVAVRGLNTPLDGGEDLHMWQQWQLVTTTALEQGGCTLLGARECAPPLPRCRWPPTGHRFIRHVQHPRYRPRRAARRLPGTAGLRCMPPGRRRTSWIRSSRLLLEKPCEKRWEARPAVWPARVC